MTQRREILLEQYQTVSLKNEELTSADLRFLRSISPQVSSSTSENITTLNPRSNIGFIRLHSISLRIIPSVREVSWETAIPEMMILCGDFPNASGKSFKDASIENDLYEVIAVSLLRQVELIIGQGLLRKYVERSELLTSLKGRIELSKLRWPEHAPKLTCKFKELSTDIPENQILSAALNRISRLSVSNTTRGLALRLIQHFPERIHDFTSNMQIPRNRLNERYQDAIRLAGLILTGSTIGPSSGIEPAVSFLFDFNKLWENTVGQLMKNQVGSSRVKTQSKRNLRGHPANKIANIEMRPDIVLLDPEEKNAKLVVDAKCKNVLIKNQYEKMHYRAGDIYQISTYSTELSVPGALVYPGVEDSIDRFYLNDKELMVITVNVSRALTDKVLCQESIFN